MDCARLWCAALICCATIISCAVQEDTPAALPDWDGAPSEQTLRECAIQKAQGTEWTQALESDRLGRDTAHHGGVSDALPLAPQIMAVASVDAAPVYPYLAGFGSLDTSALMVEVRRLLNSLLADISEGRDISPLMAEGMEYQAMFFMDDLNGWLRHCDSTVTALYSQPFFGDDGSIIVKMRLTCDGQTVDIEAALTKESTVAKETSGAKSTGTDEDGSAVRYKIEQLRLL